MKHIELLNQFRQEISKVVHEIESSTAMGHFDINKISENLVCGLFREIYEFSDLINLNNEEKKNYPGIDLADDKARVAIQVTSDKSIDKIKDTLTKAVKYKLYEKYDRIIIYILGKKQNSYSSSAIQEICGKYLKFDVHLDIIDYTTLSAKAANSTPRRLQAAFELLLTYTRGSNIGLSEQDFDPPELPSEELCTNLVEIYFPSKLFIAELIPEVIASKKGAKLLNQRKAIKDYCRNSGFTLPSDFEASSGRLITFHDIDVTNSPFRRLIDEGTIEQLSPSDYYKIDSSHERIFKSLLRFTLQQKLYKHSVIWQHLDQKFLFVPNSPNQLRRTEKWFGQKASSRMVFERKFKDTKKDEVLSTRHFAFEVDFLRSDEEWYVMLNTDWFFSFGDEYKRSFYGDKLLAGLKRMERNRSVFDQFRFLAAWLEDIDSEDLFSENFARTPTISFSKPLKLKGARKLNELLWEPLVSPVNEIMQERLGEF